MPDVQLVPAAEVPPPDLHAAFTTAFADYLIGPFTLPLVQWPQLTGRHAVALPLSRVATAGGAILAFALVAPRPELRAWRLATMGAVPAARGSGAAPHLLDDFIARARVAGCSQVELECFAQNERALRLYRSRGFEPLHELHGYSRAAGPAPGGSAAARDVPLEEAFGWLEAVSAGCADLPLQVTPVSLRALPLPRCATRARRRCSRFRQTRSRCKAWSTRTAARPRRRH